jgi:hypothetical protein
LGVAAMNDTTHSPTAENPFCTRRVRPGATPFIFPPHENADTLVDRFRQHGWWAQIIGPHGSGKSALLATLTPAIQRAGQLTALVELHDGQRRLPLDLRNDRRLHPPAVVIVDGYEQLSQWSRLVLKRFCRRRKLGLLVTTHDPVGFPELYRTAATVALAEQIVGELLAGRESPFTSDELTACYSRHHGDLRETLFDLYDLYQQRCPR